MLGPKRDQLITARPPAPGPLPLDGTGRGGALIGGDGDSAAAAAAARRGRNGGAVTCRRKEEVPVRPRYGGAG